MIADASHCDTRRTDAIRLDFPIFGQSEKNGKRLVYLDSAATSQRPSAMIERLVRYYETENANVHRGVYDLAERSTEAYESARRRLARFINAPDANEIVWTRNTSEAINLVAQTYGVANVRRGDAILVSRVEHHSNLVPWQVLAARVGAELRFIELDQSYEFDISNLDELLVGVKIVAISAVSNALGTIAPLDEIIPRAHAAGAVVLVDGAQSLPHVPVDIRALGCDFFAASAHKMCGPTGIGFLWGKMALLDEMPPFLTGGDMISRVTYTSATYSDVPRKFEAGTGSIADAVAFGAALDYLDSVGMPYIAEHERTLTAYAKRRLSELASRGLRIVGPESADTGIVSFVFADIHPHDIASLLGSDNVCVRAGHHCAMPLMDKLGLPATARASFYLYNDERDVDALMTSLEKTARIFKV